MKIKWLAFLFLLLLNNSADASWVPGRINKGTTWVPGHINKDATSSSTPKETPLNAEEKNENVAPSAMPARPSTSAPEKPVKTADEMKAQSQDPKKDQVKSNIFSSQQLSYLGQIVGTDYKDEGKTKISGFKVKIINVSHNGDVSLLHKEVYLPYVVIIKKELVTTPEVRNSGGTELSNLAIDPNALIEFDNITSVVHPTKTMGEMRVIPKRPLVSNVKASFSKL